MLKDNSPSEKKDCLQCKVVGVVTLSCLGTYFMKELVNTPKSNYKQKYFLGVLGAMSFIGAVYRGID
jgi:hypothetical protein